MSQPMGGIVIRCTTRTAELLGAFRAFNDKEINKLGKDGLHFVLLTDELPLFWKIVSY